MRRLRGLAASFLQLEIEPHPMGCLRVIVLGAPPDGSNGISLDDLRAHIVSRLDGLPSWRWRIVAVPFGLHHPVAVDDPDLDLDAHLDRVVLLPGDAGQLDRLLAERAAQPLDRNRPLWRATLVDGLDGGRQAVVLQVHHAITDGIAGRNTLGLLFGSDGVPPSSPSLSLDGRPEVLPTRRELIRDALVDEVRTLSGFPRFAKAAGRGARALRRHVRSASVDVPRMGKGTPRSVFNASFTAERRVYRTSLPLGVVRSVKEAAGATINDVTLAVIGGAVRSHLLEGGVLPDSSLVTSLPVGSDQPVAECRTGGVEMAVLFTTLATDEPDPWQRLQRVRAVTIEAKRRLEIRGRQVTADAADYFLPALARPAIRIAHRLRRAAHVRANPSKMTIDSGLVVSNVRGPDGRWRLGEQAVDEVYLSGPPMSPTPVNVTLFSYADRLFITVCGSADALPDARALGERFTGALDALVAAAAARTTERLPIHQR